MTTIPDPDNPDTESSTVPPYDGRKEAADSGEGTASEDPSTAGAAAPTSSDGELSEPDPEETEGGATASPADEQPAQEESDTRARAPAKPVQPTPAAPAGPRTHPDPSIFTFYAL